MPPHDWRPALRALLYVVQCADAPVAAADHTIQVVVACRALGATRAAYRADIATALASPESLGTLIPQPHPEETVRRFLRTVLDRLSTECGVPPAGG